MWSAEQNISQAGKDVFPRFLVMSLRKKLEPFIGFFPSSEVNRKYVHTVACMAVFVGPAERHFKFNAYPGRNATCPLSSCSNKNDGHDGALACKGIVCVEVLAGSSFPPIKPPFCSFVDPASLWRPESSGSQPVYRKLFSHGPHSSKNNFFEIKIHQMRDWETPSLSYYGSWLGLIYSALFNAALSLLWNLSLQLFTACASGSIFKKRYYRYHLRLRQLLEEKIKRVRAGPLTLHAAVVFTLEPRATFAANGKRKFVPRDQVFSVLVEKFSTWI